MKILTDREIQKEKINFKVDHTKKEYENFKINKYYGWLKETNGKKYPVYEATCKACGNQVILPIVYLSKGLRGIKSCGCSKKKLKSADYVTQEINTPAFNKLIQSYRHKAEERKLLFNLTNEEFYTIVKSDCHYCGAKPSQKYMTKSGREFIYNGIDRKHNEHGYLIHNSLPCCGMCNVMKRHHPYNSFISQINKIHAHCADHNKFSKFGETPEKDNTEPSLNLNDF